MSQLSDPLEYFTKLSQQTRETAQSGHLTKIQSSRVCCPVEEQVKILSGTDHRLVNWAYVSSLDLSVSDIHAYRHNIVWDILSEHVSLETALLFIQHINWEVFLQNNSLTYDTIVKHGLSVSWITLIDTQDVPVDIIDENIDAICAEYMYYNKDAWRQIVSVQKLSEPFIDKYAHKLDWDLVCIKQDVSHTFLAEHVLFINLCDDLVLEPGMHTHLTSCVGQTQL